jgi:hypothetical protein
MVSGIDATGWEGIGDRLRFAVRQAAHIWGIGGILTALSGLGVLLFAAFWILPAAQHLADLRAIPIDALSSEIVHGAEPRNDIGRDLDVFDGSFPPQTLVLDVTNQLNQAADQSGVRIGQADYRANQDPSGLFRYEMAFSTHATYAQVRRFIATSLTSFPTLSLDSVTLSRSSANDVLIEAQFHFSLYLADK